MRANKSGGPVLTPGDPVQSGAPIMLTMEHSIARQAFMLQCVFAADDELRQMNSAEFRQLVGERLQIFGDEIMAAWEKRYGDERT